MFGAVALSVKAPDFNIGATEVDARDFLHVVTVSGAPIEFYRFYFTQEVGAGEQFLGLLGVFAGQELAESILLVYI
jgi:hypothetical protein